MAFRTLRRRRINSLHSSIKLNLEALESRLLLAASVGDWINVDISDFDQPGYGQPDAFFSDPLGELTDTDDLAVVYDFLNNDHHDADTTALEALSGGYTLFLDFDGARVYSRSGDFWLGSDYIDIPAYDLSMYGWDGLENQSISYITQFVQEDYAAYHIEVTSVEPASGEYTTIYVGGTNDWFRSGSSVIGVATYDVGNTDASNFGFAFTEELALYQQPYYSNGSVLAFSEYVANLISHEAAHTYGANHVSDPSCMMNPYLPLTPRTQSFGSGTIPGSSQTQDTQSLLGDNLGYTAAGGDDYGDTRTTASLTTVNSTIEGLLERRDDVDAFTFIAGQTSEITVAIDTGIFGNLNSYLQIVRTDNGSLIAENNDLQSTDSGVAFDATAGTSYTILVSGYNYVSSGSYTLSITGPEADGALIIAEIDGCDDGVFTAGAINLLADNPDLDIWRLTNFSAAPVTVTMSLQEGSGFELAGENQIIIPAGEGVTVSVRVNAAFARPLADSLILTVDDAEQTTQTINISVDAYALLSQSRSYSFTDHDGDRVTVMLLGDAQAKLTLGDADEPDINSIEFTGGEGMLIILTGSGRTQLGRLTGTADVNMLMASKVDVVGEIDLNGTIGNAMLGDILGATVHFAATSRSMLQAGAITQSDIQIDGTLGTLRANSINGGSFQTDALGRVMLGSGFTGDLTVTDGDLDSMMVQRGDFSGNINILDGNLKSLMVMGGNMTGTVRVSEILDRMMLLGGTFSGSVHADDTVNMVMARDFNQASLTAMTDIGRVMVMNDMLDSLVAAGYDPDVQLEDCAAALPTVNAHLNSLSVFGTFRGSTIASGVAPDNEGNFINGQGIAAQGTLGSISLRYVETNNNAHPFGVVAQDDVDRLLVNSRSVDETFQQDDFYVTVLKG